MINLKITVDPNNVFGRQLTELERTQIPYATERALNQVAFMIYSKWRDVTPRVFRNPIARTLNAGKYSKATKRKLYTEILIDGSVPGETAQQAFKHNRTPTMYLQAQVLGGKRADKGMDVWLKAKFKMDSGDQAVPGKGALMDAAGNMQRGQFHRITSQLQANPDRYANETPVSKIRREKREAKQSRSDYFSISKPRGGLKPGIYQRIKSGFGRGVVPIMRFVRGINYRKRFDIFKMAETINKRRMPEIFATELKKAAEDAFKKRFK